jgi:hypothetical protein
MLQACCVTAAPVVAIVVRLPGAGADKSHETFDRNKFSASVTVDYQWLLVPGTEFILNGAVAPDLAATPLLRRGVADSVGT